MSENENIFDEMISAEPAAVTATPRIAKASLSDRSEEMFRGMWASLFYSERISGKCVLFSSAARREGASTIAAGLALSGGGPSGGAKVALVDFNLRSPHLHQLLKLKQGPGVAEILTDGQDIEAAAQPVNEGLDVFTTGAIKNRTLGLLKSEAIGEFFTKLAEKYDYVLVDAAAANHFPDAQILGGVLKDVVLVIHSDLTPREAVAQAKKRIEAGGGKVAGVVLNQRTFPIPNFLYRRV